MEKLKAEYDKIKAEQDQAESELVEQTETGLISLVADCEGLRSAAADTGAGLAVQARSAAAWACVGPLLPARVAVILGEHLPAAAAIAAEYQPQFEAFKPQIAKLRDKAEEKGIRKIQRENAGISFAEAARRLNASMFTVDAGTAAVAELESEISKATATHPARVVPADATMDQLLVLVEQGLKLSRAGKLIETLRELVSGPRPPMKSHLISSTEPIVSEGSLKA